MAERPIEVGEDGRIIFSGTIGRALNSGELTVSAIDSRVTFTNNQGAWVGTIAPSHTFVVNQPPHYQGGSDIHWVPANPQILPWNVPYQGGSANAGPWTIVTTTGDDTQTEEPEMIAESPERPYAISLFKEDGEFVLYLSVAGEDILTLRGENQIRMFFGQLDIIVEALEELKAK